MDDGPHAQQNTSVTVLNGLRHYVRVVIVIIIVGGYTLAGNGRHLLPDVDAGRLTIAGHDLGVGYHPGVAVAGKGGDCELPQGVTTQCSGDV